MKNPFEKPESRRSEYDETKKGIDEKNNEIEKLKTPYGHLKTDGLFANMCHETLNTIASLPNTPERKMLEIKVKFAQKKLERIYASDEKEAFRLNDQYDKIIKKEIDSGDSTERDEFEKNILGMNKVEESAE